MSKLESLAARLPSVDERSVADIDQEISDELDFHLQMRTEEGLRSGVSPEEARHKAAIRFGNYDQIRNSCRRVLLGERIMWQRIQTILIALLVIAVVGMGMSMYHVQRANNSALTELAAAVHEMAKPPAALRRPAAWLTDRPHVVETSPTHDAIDVDPDTAEIRVTFDKPMTDKSWSWCRSSSNDYPETTGEVHYLDDMKTCVMPVKLESGKKYTVWFNTANYQNFKDADGRPAEPDLLTFTTRQ
jgi:Big-like domain-containing protein